MERTPLSMQEATRLCDHLAHDAGFKLIEPTDWMGRVTRNVLDAACRRDRLGGVALTVSDPAINLHPVPAQLDGTPRETFVMFLPDSVTNDPLLRTCLVIYEIARRRHGPLSTPTNTTAYASQVFVQHLLTGGPITLNMAKAMKLPKSDAQDCLVTRTVISAGEFAIDQFDELVRRFEPPRIGEPDEVTAQCALRWLRANAPHAISREAYRTPSIP